MEREDTHVQCVQQCLLAHPGDANNKKKRALGQMLNGVPKGGRGRGGGGTKTEEE